MLTRTFAHLRKEDVAIAGGKGASLGEMTQAGKNRYLAVIIRTVFEIVQFT